MSTEPMFTAAMYGSAEAAREAHIAWLRKRIAELEREEEVTDHVIERTTRLLAECVVILRGPEPPLTKWSYHDIPQLVQALKDDRDRLRAENEALRDLLCSAHAGVLAYRDDGEMQDSTTHPCIDFKRDTPEQIRSALHRRADAARAAREGA